MKPSSRSIPGIESGMQNLFLNKKPRGLVVCKRHLQVRNTFLWPTNVSVGCVKWKKETCLKCLECWLDQAYHIQTGRMPGFAFSTPMTARNKVQDRLKVKLQILKKKQGQIFPFLSVLPSRTAQTILYAGIWLSCNIFWISQVLQRHF